MFVAPGRFPRPEFLRSPRSRPWVMHETIVRLPHAVGGLPILGAGWVLIAMAAALTWRLWTLSRTSPGSPDAASPWSTFAAGELWMWLIAAGVVWRVLPTLELRNIDGDPVGMAVRGYGVFLLAGVLGAIGLAAYRARRRGIDPDLIYRMAPWAFFGGILGARLFYVIQYRHRFVREDVWQTLAAMLKFTEGGLVVYGAFIGGAAGVLWFLWRHRIPILKLGDVIVPCLFLGIFFGRMGCLMHGCCWGGRCEASATSLQFPPGSPVYQDQMLDGSIVGLTIDPATRTVDAVANASPAASSGIRVGDTVDSIEVQIVEGPAVRRDVPIEEVRQTLFIRTTSSSNSESPDLGSSGLSSSGLSSSDLTASASNRPSRTHRFTPAELPPRALPVHAAQLISSMGGLILCLSLCAIPAGRVREGTVMWLGFAGYAVLRFALEWVRVDEAGQFGTSLSISQWVSLLVLGIAVVGYALQRRLTTPTEAAVANPVV